MALLGCQANQVPGCNDKIGAAKCLQRFAAQGDRAVLLNCVHFSEPQKITGTWIFGFELNEFYEGEQPSRKDWDRHDSDTELQADVNIPNDGRHRMFRLELVGRRSQCPMGFPRNIILVDRITSSRLNAVRD